MNINQMQSFLYTSEFGQLERPVPSAVKKLLMGCAESCALEFEA